MRKTFSFIYPVTQQHTGLSRIGGKLYDHVADLLVKGVAYITNASVLNNISHKYSFDISEILFNGKNIYPHHELFESIENIRAACLNHIEQFLGNPQSNLDAYDEPPKMYPVLGKLVTLSLKRRVK